MTSRWTWIVLGALVIGAAGCGGGDASSSTTSASSVATSTTTAADGVPTAAGPLSDLVDALEHVGQGGDCTLALQVVTDVGLPDPAGGDSAANCKSALSRARVLRGFKAVQSQQFGTGGVVDGTKNGKELTLIVAIDGSGAFRWPSLTLPRAETGTKPLDGVDYRKTAESLVAALRHDDCHAAYDAIAPGTRLSYASEKQFCSFFEENYLGSPATLGSRLRADRDAELTDLGGTRDAHFYGLATKPAGYRTVIVSADPEGGTKVVDVVPVER